MGVSVGVRYGYTVLLLACMSFMAHAQTIKLPAEVKGDPGSFIRVPADTEGAQVRWYSPDAGLALFPVDLLRDSKTAIVIGSKGRYRLVAWTAKGDVPSLPAECVVIIGDVPPGPTPVPPGPTPPGPGPTPPPVDPLIQQLQAAYATDGEPDKSALKAKLAALYRQGAEFALNRTTLTTFGQLFTAMKEAAVTLGISGKLANTQRAISEVLKAEVGADGLKPLDTGGREQAAKVFRRVAAALEKVE